MKKTLIKCLHIARLHVGLLLIFQSARDS